LDFVILEGDAMHAAVEDDIALDLARVGITLNKRFLNKEDFNEAMRTGDFHLCFSETWGAPYDPVSYATGWMANDEGHYSAMEGLTGYNSRENTFAKIDLALAEVDPTRREELWAEIHDMVHQSAINLPLWGKQMPAVLNRRLSGYVSGQQQFDYPVQKIVVLEGSKTVTVAPGAQTGLFKSVGRMDPHSYRPNEFFSNNWLYEGLVSYGPDGAILPSLAESWTETADGMVFKLRTGVKFHNGEDWNCAAAKLNFDHVFAEPMRTTDWHGWYKLPLIFDGAECNADGDLVLKITGGEYSNMLQELTFIRPARMLAPAAFMSSAADSWMTHNSCPTGWGEISTADGSVTITCVGTTGEPFGTGPFKFASRTLDADGNDEEAVFHRFDEYWGGAPDIEVLIVKNYATAAEVFSAI
jgi:ABC-type transport system substrate-binding protein